MTQDTVVNVVVAGLGGQGVLKASDILADAAHAAALDVKKSEIHGMSQRGGSVTSDVRFGQGVLSPMIPTGQAHYLVVLEPTQVEPNAHLLAPDGTLLTSEAIDTDQLGSMRSLNVAMLGLLSAHLDKADKPAPDAETILKAALANLPENVHEANRAAFELGRAAAA